MDENPLLRLLRIVCERLEAAGATYAITGSVASSLHGQAVSSLDVDLCVRMSADDAARFAASLPPELYRSDAGLLVAARSHTMSNVIDPASGLKVDLSFLSPSPFHESVLRRRRLVAFAPGGPSFWTVSAEDIILMKLLWRKDTRSRKQWDNALSVVKVNGARLDWSYLRAWAERLGLTADLELMMKEAEL